MTSSRGRSIAAILAASALAAACTATVMPGPAQSSVSPAPSARPEMDATIYFARERQAPLGVITENGTTAVIGGEGLVVDRPITRTELIEDAYGADQRER